MVHGWIIPAVILVLLAGAAKETAPIFAALFAWNPLPFRWTGRPAIVSSSADLAPTSWANPNTWILAHPIQAGRKYHHRMVIDAMPILVTPWVLASSRSEHFSIQLAATSPPATSTPRRHRHRPALPMVRTRRRHRCDLGSRPTLVAAHGHRHLFNLLRGDGV